MALLKCKECGGDVSDKAAACPKCGNPIVVAQETKAGGSSSMILFLILFVLCIVFWKDLVIPVGLIMRGLYLYPWMLLIIVAAWGLSAIMKARQRGELVSWEDLGEVKARWRELYAVDSSAALMTATWQGRVEEVRKLLAAGANPNATKDDGSTALMRAAWHGNALIAELLLAAGANPDAANKDGKTALDFAKENKHAKVVRVLEAAAAE